MIGQQIENYKILSKLGEGAMGVVFKAMDVNLERVVALKLMNAGLSHHPDLEARFRAEARTQATLNHHNIATLYSFLTWEGKAVMVMEYVDGKTLQQMVGERGALPPVTALALCKQALYGVGAAHKQNIVHRDLKPANLMLSNEGVIKVMDFGIAKIKGGAGLKGTAMAIGTYDYMAPEQALNKAVDGRADIYSMGITLYELLTGDVPFKADSGFAVQMAHLNEPPLNPMEHNPAIPQSVAEVVLRALEKNPDDRFATTEEFIRALPRLSDASGQIPRQQQPGSGTMVDTGGFTGSQAAYTGAQRPSAGWLPPNQPPTRPPMPPPTEFQPQQPSFGGAQGVRVDPPLVAHGPVVVPPFQAKAPRKSNTGMLLGVAAAAAVAVALVAGWFYFRPKPGDTKLAAPAKSVAQPQQVAKAVPPSVPHKDPPPVSVKPDPNLNSKPNKTVPDNGHSTVPPPDPAPQPKPIPTPVPTGGDGLVGAWTGSYLDSATQQTTFVNFTFRGTEANLTGSANFKLPDQTAGECSVSGSSYDATKRTLTLEYTSCKGVKAPAFLHTPTIFSNVDSTAKTLKGGRVMYMSTVNAVFAKSAF